jgi:hypothetical protein
MGGFVSCMEGTINVPYMVTEKIRLNDSIVDLCGTEMWTRFVR